MKPGIGAHGPYDATAVTQTGSFEEGRLKDTEKCISHLRAAPPQPSRVRGADGLPEGCSNRVGQLQKRPRTQPEPEPVPLSRAAMAQPEASSQSPSKAAGQPYFTARANGQVDKSNLNRKTKFDGTEDLIVCRHLALQELCDRQKEDSQGPVHNRHRADRRADQRGTLETMAQVMESGLEQRFKELRCGAEKNYAIDHAKLGEFFYSVFRGMQPSSKRYMLMYSGNHAMAVRMRVKDGPQGARYVINFYNPNRTLTDKRYFTDDNFEQVKKLRIQSFLEQREIDRHFGGQGKDNRDLTVFVQEVPGDFHVRPLSVPFESRTLDLFLSDQQTIHPGLVHHLMRANMPGGQTLDLLKAQLGQCASEQKQGFDFLSGKNHKGSPALFMALQKNNVEAVRAFGKLFDFAAEKGFITGDQPFNLLFAAAHDGAPALYMALQENNVEVARVFCDLVISTAEKNLITKQELFNLLSANHKGVPALYMALQENNVEVARDFCDLVICAAEKNLITKEDLFNLLSANYNGKPALFIALRMNNAEVARVFCKAVASAAEKNLITDDEASNLLSEKRR